MSKQPTIRDALHSLLKEGKVSGVSVDDLLPEFEAGDRGNGTYIVSKETVDFLTTALGDIPSGIHQTIEVIYNDGKIRFLITHERKPLSFAWTYKEEQRGEEEGFELKAD